jgi:hypothetical protein
MPGQLLVAFVRSTPTLDAPLTLAVGAANVGGIQKLNPCSSASEDGQRSPHGAWSDLLKSQLRADGRKAGQESRLHRFGTR